MAELLDHDRRADSRCVPDKAHIAGMVEACSTRGSVHGALTERHATTSDWENLNVKARAFLYLASIRLMVRRLCRE